MKKQIKTKLLEALRSGEYKQGKHVLHGLEFSVKVDPLKEKSNG